MIPLLFAAFAAVLVASSLLVILHRNPVTSALFLVLAFCSLAALYLLLGAEFVGMVQVIVYAGAIMVLFLFVIMLLSLGESVGPAKVTFPRVVGGLAATGLFVALVVATKPFVPVGADPPAGFGTLQSIGAQLYTQWLAPFEAVSLLLLVAMVGAVVVAKSRV